MEHVGKKVKKEFEGHGVFVGTVEAYDEVRGLFRIVYEDGDSEDMELSEITSLMNDDGGNRDDAIEQKQGQLQSGADELTRKASSRCLGRKPKKRRRVVAEKKSSTSPSGNLFDNESNFGEEEEEEGVKELDLNKEVTVNLGENNNKNDDRLNLDLNEHDDEVVNSNLNKGNVDLDLNKELDLNDGLEQGCRIKVEFIDLNMDVTENETASDNEIFEKEKAPSGSLKRKGRGFDLNLGLEDETKSSDSDSQVQVNDTQEREVNYGNNASLAYMVYSGNVEQQTPLKMPSSGLVDDAKDDITGVEHMGSDSKGRRGRKRKKVLDGTPSAAPEMVLRRSSRRARRASLSAQDCVTSGLDGGDDSSAVSGVSEEKVTLPSLKESEEQEALPPKVELPSSSDSLNLKGMPVLDVFSVYSFLRSFSMSLFLSPFELEDFVASVKCNVSNLLFDSIHVSLLQTLRKHLMSLSDESSCDHLRSLNWDLLDLITWPIFLIEYMLMHSCGLQFGFDLCRLKLCGSDYFKQPADLKMEVLRCLCDDVNEVEAIRSELNRRVQGTELNADHDRSMKLTNSKKKRKAAEVVSAVCLTEEVVDEEADWNSDECCLCKMDGSLICCDGCPAAFHARCVGVASSLLPEGDWYCPECLIDKDSPWSKVRKSIRGAEFLGSDPYGRIFQSSCGYLLVSDSCDSEYPLKYYHSNDLIGVIEALKSSSIYHDIVMGIIKHWHLPFAVDGLRKVKESQSPGMFSEYLSNAKMCPVQSLCFSPSGNCSKDGIANVGERLLVSGYPDDTGSKVSEVVNMETETSNHCDKIESQPGTSEKSAEGSQAVTGSENVTLAGLDYSNKFSEKVHDSEIQEKFSHVGDCSLTSIGPEIELGKNINSMPSGHSFSTSNTRSIMMHRHSRSSYVNSYNFARTASSIVEDMAQKASDKMSENAKRSLEETVSGQLKVISNKFSDFFWPNIQNWDPDARKEKCGWCFACQFPEDERDCFFIMKDKHPALESYTSEVLGVRPTKNRKGHFVDVMCHILCIEDRLQGLLLGPWLNPQYPKLWRKSVLKASDIAALKILLLRLESNLRHLALSADWLKPVDSVPTLGSAQYVVTSSPRIPSKQGTSRKKARCTELEATPSSKARTGRGYFWWRGGSLSRELYNWKVLPYSLARKAARQAGCKKIAGVLYPENSEFAKRNKFVAWRAAVETSSSVEQLALQVRELDSNIRWDDIGNTNINSMMNKESKKSVSSFKKAIIRRKSCEGTVVKYLLDFGKRRFIPDIVRKHGTMIDESSSERKKYWLEEAHVPLHLLKLFEERRIARKSTKVTSGKVHKSRTMMKKPFKKKGFSYLFSKAERSDNYQCGHCKKDVLIREAVSCQYCQGFFHRRHVKKSAGSITSESAYTCHKCQDGTCRKVDTKKGKSELHKSKKAAKATSVRSKIRKSGRGKQTSKSQDDQKHQVVIPLRRSARKAKCAPDQKKKTRGQQMGKQTKSSKGTVKKTKKGTRQKKRTQLDYSYWINGLRLSRKPNDERVTNFRRNNLVIVSAESAPAVDQPKCGICGELETTPMLNYIACETCGDWFHGDAFNLRAENIGAIIGFKCHKCRSRDPPDCPHRKTIGSDKLMSVRNNTDLKSEATDRKTGNQVFPNDESVEQKSPLKREVRDTSADNENKALEVFPDSEQALSLGKENGQQKSPLKRELRDTSADNENKALEVFPDSEQALSLDKENGQEQSLLTGEHRDTSVDNDNKALEVFPDSEQALNLDKENGELTSSEQEATGIDQSREDMEDAHELMVSNKHHTLLGDVVFRPEGHADGHNDVGTDSLSSKSNIVDREIILSSLSDKQVKNDLVTTAPILHSGVDTLVSSSELPSQAILVTDGLGGVKDE